MLFLILLLPPTCNSQVMKKKPQGYINDDQTQKISSKFLIKLKLQRLNIELHVITSCTSQVMKNTR